MLKQANPVKEIERQAATLFEELLGRVASLKLNSIKVDPRGPDLGVDILARVTAGSKEYLLVGEVKRSGQPRFAREQSISYGRTFEEWRMRRVRTSINSTPAYVTVCRRRDKSLRSGRRGRR